MQVHLVFEAFKFFIDVLHGFQGIKVIAGLGFSHFAVTLVLACGRVGAFHNIGNRLNNASRRNTMGLVVLHLHRATAIGLIHSPLHGPCNFVGIEHRLAFKVSCRATNGLNQRLLRAQKALFVRIKDRHQRDLWYI